MYFYQHFGAKCVLYQELNKVKNQLVVGGSVPPFGVGLGADIVTDLNTSNVEQSYL